MISSDNLGDVLAPRIFDGIWWSAEVPEGWKASGEGQCATFQAQPPLGALQISSARKDTKPVSDGDLKEFAGERITGGVQLRQARYGPFSGFSVEHLKERRFWKEWWLRSGSLMVYVTYNVIMGKQSLEKEMVETLLRSLKPIPN